MRFKGLNFRVPRMNFRPGYSLGNPGTILAIVLSIFIIISFTKLYNFFFAKSEEQKSASDLQDAIDKIRIYKTNLSDAELLGITEAVFNELNSTFYVSGKMIHNMLSPLSVSDLVYVYRAFGVREFKFWYSLWDIRRLDLFGWFNNTLTKSEQSNLKELFDATSLTYNTSK